MKNENKYIEGFYVENQLEEKIFNDSSYQIKIIAGKIIIYVRCPWNW
jgi:hypothetical protein